MMKSAFLLLMTPGMSLEKWDRIGQLSREVAYYKELCERADRDLIIYSYGRNDEMFLKGFPRAKVLTMYPWIPKSIPFRVQNFIYNFFSLFSYRNYFKSVVLAKTNQFSATRFGLLLKFFYRFPLVIRMGFYYSHFKPISRKRKFEEKLSFKYCDLILTTSSEASNHIVETYGIPRKKILTIGNSINLTNFKPLTLEKEYDLMFLGRLERSKNIELILSVINKVSLKTLIIGKGSLSPMIKQAISDNPMVEWKERVDNIDLPVYYNKSKCYLVLSEYEGNPKALLEAMACGIAVIGTNVPGTRECIKNNVNGILIDKDPDKIAAEVFTLCNDPQKANLLGNNALSWIRDEGDAIKNIEKEIQFYTTLNRYSVK
jgi:glycosyltransferase involved in cell wall biosynthesis